MFFFSPTLIDVGFIEDKTEFTEEGLNHSEWNCSQLVVMTYYHLGIVESFDGHTHTITPGDLFEDFVTSKDYDFDPPVLVWENS